MPALFNFCYRSPEHWSEGFRTWYGPTLKAFEALLEQDRPKLHADLLELIARFNVADDGTMVVPAEYLEVVITRG